MKIHETPMSIIEHPIKTQKESRWKFTERGQNRKWRDSGLMGSGASFPKTEEEALAQGFSLEDIEKYNATNWRNSRVGTPAIKMQRRPKASIRNPTRHETPSPRGSQCALPL